ncbi:unnamed protein product [Kluyveromyces dobzhanskii CBS 2104]|uniref:WGS project CCBQ000000000 data, contig 00058 n=1 Tax=Kluyveromyces dobzhanskii CBS 2104 TaxID=1427455 RepID=A0A0A8LDN3_9SACH|nr:unnamed protein product [Kluyveromyces dobzhanskii CBS 2104]
MSGDTERQPLLREGGQESRSPEPLNGLNKGHSTRTKAGIAAAVVLLVTSLILGLTYINAMIPDNISLKEHVGNITNVEVDDVSFNGWTYIEKQRYYKLRVKSTVFLDYESGSAVSEKQKRFLSFMGNNILKELCVDLNSLDTFKQEDGNSSISLGRLIIPNTTCINLQHNTTTNLDILVLVKPDTNELIPVIRRIWEKKYDGLEIWSSMDAKFRKRVLSYDIVLLSLNKAKLYWKDFGLWENLLTTLRHLSAEFYEIRQGVEVSDTKLSEIDDGYSVCCSIRIPNPFGDMHNSIDPATIISPEMKWQTTFPGCRDEHGIKLENMVVYSPELNWESVNQPFVNLTLQSELNGELPYDFLNHVCASDDSNVITPLSKLIKQLLDPEYPINFEINCCGTETGNNSSALLDDYTTLVPYLDTSLSVNYTINVDNIVREVGTRGIKLQWSTDFLGRRKLIVKGKIVAKVQIPFYQLKEDTTFSMQRIKGRTKLFHNGVHMLTVPLDYWTKCITAVVIDEDEPENSYFDVSFDIDNDQIIIEDTLALSRCINEVVFKGEATIFLEGILDLMVSTSVGDVVVLGLPGEGSAVVRP